MKNTELRIGNKLQKSNGEIFTVLRLDNTNDVLVEEQRGLLTLGHNLSGIPLTEEWLLKFGFELKDRVNMGFTKQINYPHMKNYLYANSKSYTTAFWDESKQMEFFINPCQYVHQLQNLYFALTGEELQTK